jgi:RND superfamily putative drug exporter
LAALARWCFHHRKVVVLTWIALLVTLVAVERSVGSAYETSFMLPGTESFTALEKLKDTLPDQAGSSATIVWHVDDGSVRDPQTRTRIEEMLAKVVAAKSVAAVVNPYDPANPAGAMQISQDGKTAYATVDFEDLAQNMPPEDIRNVMSLAKDARAPGLQVELGGNAIAEVNHTPPSFSVAIGLVAAAIIILIAFGSLFGMTLPLITAVMALASGTMAIALLSHATPIPVMAPMLAELIGLGVGIDYALFIVSRHRDGLKAGSSPEESTVRALNTSGRAVLFAGGTVCIALLGLLVLNLSFLTGMAFASVVTVVFMIVASLTLLPSMFGFMQARVLSKKERRRLAGGDLDDGHGTSHWARWAGFVSRRPVILAIASLTVILVLAYPVLSLRLGSSDEGNDPAGSTTRKAYDLLAAAFGPGSNGPLLLVAEIGSPADQAAVAALAEKIGSVPNVSAVAPMPSAPGAKVALIQVIPGTSPQDKATTELIKTLRTEVIPQATQGTTLRVYVGGMTAIFDDFTTVIQDKLPLFIGVIVALGCLLLFVAFRSLLVPATAAVMNLLAAGAAFGVVVAVFQWGWLPETFGLGKAGPVEPFLPVIMLAILFGLSMDYQVFLVSRMHEEWVHTRDNTRAIIVGQATTGRVITAAAAIMMCVFGAFAIGGQRVIAEFGIGLAVAVAIDAFILRTVLVPAVMHLFGARNWWLPRSVDAHLPHLAVEPTSDALLPDEA